MDTITIYKRFENETDEELIYRICQAKEQIGTWQDVTNIINELTNFDFGESTYRKKFQSFVTEVGFLYATKSWALFMYSVYYPMFFYWRIESIEIKKYKDQ